MAKRTIRLTGMLLLLCASVCSSVGAQSVQEHSVYEQASIQQAEEDKDLRAQFTFEIAAVKPSCRVSQPVYITATWTNISDKKVVTDDTHLRVVNFDVRNEDGERVIPFQYGMTVPFNRITVKPGKSYVVNYSINGCDQFEDVSGYTCRYLAPGSYTVAVESGEAAYYSNKVNTVVIRIE